MTKFKRPVGAVAPYKLTSELSPEGPYIVIFFSDVVVLKRYAEMSNRQRGGMLGATIKYRRRAKGSSDSGQDWCFDNYWHAYAYFLNEPKEISK